MKLLRNKDRVNLSLEELKISLSPLSFRQKVEIDQCKRLVSGEEISDDPKKIFLMLKHSVKKLEGLELYDGKPYKLEFEENGSLDDDSTDDIMNMDIREGIIIAIAQIMGGKAEEIEGVEINVGK